METKHLHGVTGFATQADVRAIEQRLDMLEKEIAELRSAIQGG